MRPYHEDVITTMSNKYITDTPPLVGRVQVELLRQAGLVRRFELARRVSATVIQMARRAIAGGHPQWSEDEVRIEFIRLNYGQALADGVRRRLGAMTHGGR